MNPLVILSKTHDKITFVDKEPKMLSREEIANFIENARSTYDFDKLEADIRLAEDRLAEVVNEIDQKVKDKEEYETDVVVTSLEEARRIRDAAITEAHRVYDLKIQELKTHTEALAEELCKLKEDEIHAATDNVRLAKRILIDAREDENDIKRQKEIYTELLSIMNAYHEVKEEVKQPVVTEQSNVAVRPTRLKF